jgi:DNA processing protein
MKNKPYLLALNRAPLITPRVMKKLLEQFTNLADFFSLTAPAMQELGIKEAAALSLKQFDWSTVEQDLAWEDSSGNNTILSWLDPRYPRLLKEISSAPPILYAKGDLKSFDLPSVAIIGSRKPTPIGREMARNFAYQLSQHGITITSGLALGIDSEAHKGSLLANGRTIAVLGTGIDTIYPSIHLALARKISATGLIITEFPLKTKPLAGHFPRRNRIISGLSMATLVVEAAMRSGSLITAHLALEQNRDVLAIPGSIHNPQSTGCHYLIKQGAKLVTSVEDILAEVLPQYSVKSLDKQPQKILKESLLNFIGYEVTTIDQIQTRSGLSLERVICDLATLEIKGLVQAITGGYMRCAI